MYDKVFVFSSLTSYQSYHSATKELFLDLFECLMKATNHQLFSNLENLLMKICLNLRYILKFSKATDTIDFGETLNRVLVLALAKTLKTK